MDIKQEIVRYIENNPSTTFLEIEQLFKDNEFDYKGDLVLNYQNFKNIILWSKWNQPAVKVLEELLNEGKIRMNLSNGLVYETAGGVLNLPIARSFKEKDEQEWLPVTFKLA